MQDVESGERKLALVRREQVGPTVPEESIDQLIDWSARHERTLSENAFGYRRHAEQLLLFRLDEAGRVRREMLAFENALSTRRPPDQWGNLELLTLIREVEFRRQMPHTDLNRVAVELDTSRTTLWRLRKEAERRDLRA